METFQENLEHQKRGKGRKRQQTDRIAQRDGLARPPVGQRSRRRDNKVVRSNGPGNGHTAPKVRLRWMAVGGVTPHPGVRNSLQLALFKL